MNEFSNPLLLEPLTDRELEILGLIADGLSNPEIADRLIIGLETVRWYTKQIYSKLGVHSRTQASKYARDLGLLTDEPPPISFPITLPRRSSNLPTYTIPFVGREYELAELASLLDNPDVRLITLVGPGGMGKTRLSVELARTQINSFADGVFFISLVSLSSPADLGLLIANKIALRLGDQEDVQTQLLNYLQPKQILLILDNFERVMEGAAFVAAILERAPHVKIIVTSHISLNLRQEWVRYLDALRTPEQDGIENIDQFGAVKLFGECVRRVRGDFSVVNHLEPVVQICQMVGGVPLAIELAAAWLKTLSVEDVAQQIQRNIDFLATKHHDVEERHRSIQAVFDYAWNLLTSEEQRIFRRLSVFRGGFGLAAAEQVAGASIHSLSELVGKSLLQQSATGLYEIHDLLRQYAERKLEELDIASRSSRSSQLLAWTSLVKGNFDKVEEIANAALNLTSDTTTSPEKGFALAALGVLAGVEEDYPRCKQLCEASIPVVRVDPIGTILAHLGLTIAHSGLGDFGSIKHFVRIALEQAAGLRSAAFSILCLPFVAIVLAYEVQPERAVEVLSLAISHPASSLKWIQKWPLIGQLENDLMAEMDESAYAAAWERGKSLQLEQVVDDILAEF